MMKIKMKVKTMLWILVGLLFFVFIIVPFANNQIAYNLRYSKPEISEKLYKASLRYPINFMKDEVLYNLSEDIMGGFGRDNVFLKARVGIKSIDYKTIISVTENYKKIINKYPDSKYFVPSYKSLMDSYMFLGDSDNLERWIDWGKNKDDEIRQMSIFYDGYNHFANKEYEKAEEILENAVNLGNRELDYMYYFVKGHIEFLKENFDQALKYYDKASDLGWQHETHFFGSYAPDERKYWLENLQYNNGKNKIKGRVVVENKGLPFVPVFLQYPNEGYGSRGGQFIGISDKDGYFETIGVKDGKYEIGVGVGSHILYDKVYLEKSQSTLNVSSDMEIDFKFTSPGKVLKPSPKEIVKEGKFVVEWEEVPYADYYNINTIVFSDVENSTGSGSFTIEQIRGENSKPDTKIDLHIDKLNNDMGMMSWSEDDGPVNPEAILGYFYSGAERPIIVNAYDKDGNMLSSSMPSTSYYENVPSVKIENGELTKGEKIILSKDYEGAIEYYKDILSEDENNEESLEYLARIHMIDWKRDKKDMSKAISYSKRLYDLTDDTKILERTLRSMYSEDYIKYSDEVEELLSLIPNENMTDELYSSRGEYYKSIGEFEKVREDFLIAKFDHLYSDIIYIDLYFREEDIALDRLKKEKINFYRIDKRNLIKGIEGLSKVDKGSKEYKDFKEYLSSLLKREGDYEERKAEFNKIYKSIKDPSIRIILNEIRADNHWN